MFLPLLLSMLGKMVKISAFRILFFFFFFFFLGYQKLDISYKLLGDSWHEISNLFFADKKKKYYQLVIYLSFPDSGKGNCFAC